MNSIILIKILNITAHLLIGFAIGLYVGALIQYKRDIEILNWKKKIDKIIKNLKKGGAKW